jgi:hypothetical protein
MIKLARFLGLPESLKNPSGMRGITTPATCPLDFTKSTGQQTEDSGVELIFAAPWRKTRRPIETKCSS